ncbi:hypothetical protein KAF25_011042 [Fusarium avenaceum]|uniref:Protein NO VEIN C-terminal domain-containing protein n=1 Tax=Fusarium avenaceum TaxID=40199 RepID=A0A9P7GV98_9HYPO|nr:hypothetical protein KAF25_011042 [Fusarium avenaceum]
MSGMARSKSEAESHFEHFRMLRKPHGADADPHILFWKSKALNGSEILAHDLYQTPTHFLLELIQNADDNAYSPDVTPSLNLVLSGAQSRTLRIDCNEIGFTFEQIKALSAIGDSTKRAISRRQRSYIGQKGIGFKSVFKAADIVKIASGYYEFQFDGRQPMGMVLPTESPFPKEHRLPNHTQFLLMLKDERIHEKIRSNLADIEPELLLFLRNLRHLKIDMDGSQRACDVHYNISNDILGERITITSTQGVDCMSSQSNYIVARSICNDMPENHRRAGVKRTEVTLAFPVDDSNSPTIGRQKAFAFLPIDDFGFKFLIHADFLLVASRESLDYDCLWNDKLREVIRTAFLLAVKRFVNVPTSGLGPGLRHLWPKYLQHHGASHDFWNQLHQDILHDLRYENILESCDPLAGHRRPMDLRFIPPDFRHKGEALFDTSSLRNTQLSFLYDNVHEELMPLGLQTTTMQDLCNDLASWIQEVGVSELGTKGTIWHRKVASLFCGHVELKDQLLSLPIIPLRDGSWVNGRKPRLYQAMLTGDEYVPSGIDLFIIDQSASQDLERRRFYDFLGIPAYNPTQVCPLILKLHAGSPSSVEQRTRRDLVKDAIYLFRKRDQVGSDRAPDIYFSVTNQGQYSRRKDLIYIIDRQSQPSLIEKYKDTPKNPFYILDDLYMKFMREDDMNTQNVFREWLLKSSSISTVPILLRDHYPTPEWAFLRDTEVTDLFVILEQTCKYGTPNPRLMQVVPELLVNCRDGTRRPLAELAIPTKEMLRLCPHLDFADLREPERWGFLSKFGILTRPNTVGVLQELDFLAGQPADLVDKDAVHECYRRLNESSAQERNVISRAFSSKPLIFIARPQPAWVTQDFCVWNAPSALKHVTRLSSRYGDCQTLFNDYLGVQSASIKHVADELCSLHERSNEDITQRCDELLLLLNRYLTPETEFTAHHFLRIRHARVFPIVEAGNAPWAVLRPLQHRNWYIPDRMTLEADFRNKVNLLAFSVQSVEKLQFLWLKLNCQSLFLSNAVDVAIQPRGDKRRDLSKEAELQTRVRYISSLNTSVATGHPEVPPVRVWGVDSIVKTSCLCSVKVEKHDALVTFDEKSDFTEVYFRTIIPEKKQEEAMYALAHFFFRRYNVVSEDNNLLNHLLRAPVEDLATIMLQNNRFPPSDIDHPLDLTDERKPDEMDVIDLDRLEEHEGGQSHRPLNFPTLPTQCSLRDLVTSFESRSRNVKTSAWNFRISKRFKQISSTRERARRERLQRSLLMEDYISSHEAILHPATMGGEGYGSPPELTAHSTSQQDRTREIGSLGELFVHTLFERHIEGWSFENWTSKLRVENGYEPFTLPEGQFADFTYLDHSGYMRAFLLVAGLEPNAEWSSSTTYHVEVKTTTSDGKEPFFVSQNQVNMMRSYHDDGDNAYIIMRVSKINNESPELKCYPNPWLLHLDGTLQFTSTDGYKVRESRLPGPTSS